MAPKTKKPQKRTIDLSGPAMGANIFAEVVPLLIAGLEAMEIAFTITATTPWSIQLTYEYDEADYE